MNRRFLLVIFSFLLLVVLSHMFGLPGPQAATPAPTPTRIVAAQTTPVPTCRAGTPLSQVFLPDSTYIHDLLPLADGNTLLHGGADGKDGVWLAKMDTDGKLLWQNLYGTTNGRVSLAQNGNILLDFNRFNVEIDLEGKVVRTLNTLWYWPNTDGGFTVSDGSKLARYKDFQTPLWQVEVEDAGDFTLTTDGGGVYAYAGAYVDTSVYYAPVYTDIKVIKVSPEGHVTQRVFGRLMGDEMLERMVRTADGGVLLVGTHYYEMLGADKDIWLMKINAGGSLSWQTTLKLKSDGEVLSDILMLKSGYLLSIETLGSLDPVLVYVKPNGGVYWQKVITSSRGLVRVNAAAPTTDGGLLLSGQTWEKTSLYWLAKLDSKGGLVWEKTLGSDIKGAVNSEVVTMVELANKQILLGGLTNQLGGQVGAQSSAWIAQIADDGEKLGLLSLSPGKFSLISSLGVRPNTLPKNEVITSKASVMKEITIPVAVTTLESKPVCLPVGAVYPTPAALPSLTPSATFTPTFVPTPVLTRDLYLTSPTMQGDDVLMLQERLYELGYTEVGVRDGIFGKMTQQAVIHFQERNALEVDGYVGPLTWRRLFSQTANPAKN